MKYSSTIVALAFVVIGCQEPLAPSMTVTKDETVETLYAEPSCQAEENLMLATDEPFYLYHQLPKFVVPPEPLRIEMETVCGSFSRSVEHVEGELLRVPMTAPPGSECGLTITATIANSTIRCDVPTLEEAKTTSEPMNGESEGPCFDVSLCPSNEGESDTTTG